MLPYASGVTLLDRSRSNRTWLHRELAAPRDSWMDFWREIVAGHPDHAGIAQPLTELRARARVRHGNALDLPAGRYDLATMFFVAESMTTVNSEFVGALRAFAGCLVAGAPFAAAFMRESLGYVVGGTAFPACKIEEADVESALEPVAREVRVVRVDSEGLRDGYDGMMVATGFRR